MGTASMEDAVATPQIPPYKHFSLMYAVMQSASFEFLTMKIPNNERTAKKVWNVLQKPVPIWRATMHTRLMTRGHLRPKRSERTPRASAPTDRNRRVRVIDVVILCVFEAVTAPKKGVDRLFTASETQKKSSECVHAKTSDINHPCLASRKAGMDY